MDNFWNILKRVDIRNEAQYERASPDERRKWHRRQGEAYSRRLKHLQTTATVTNEDSPMYKEMVELQELYRFHYRQVGRIDRGTKQDFYSLNLENNRQHSKGVNTPQGNPMPYKELSQEIYENLTTEQKRKYHSAMEKMPIADKEIKFHRRMFWRIQRNLQHPTFAASKYGGESAYDKTHIKEEYENMSNDEKIKYHSKIKTRFGRKGNLKMRNFHRNMEYRLRTNSKLPTFYSPEEEQ